MHTELPPVPELFERREALRGVAPKPAAATALARCPATIVAVMLSGGLSRLPRGRTHVVQACKFVQRVTANDGHPDSPSKLLLHDGKGAPFRFELTRGDTINPSSLAAAWRAKTRMVVLKSLPTSPNHPATRGMMWRRKKRPFASEKGPTTLGLSSPITSGAKRLSSRASLRSYSRKTSRPRLSAGRIESLFQLYRLGQALYVLTSKMASAVEVAPLSSTRCRPEG